MLDRLSPDPKAIGKYTPLLSWIWGQVDTYVGNLSARNYLAKLEPRSYVAK